jgi:hypothetical protein
MSSIFLFQNTFNLISVFCKFSSGSHHAMDIEIPQPVLIIWQIFAAISLLLFIISFIFILMNKKLKDNEKILWLLGTVLLPVLGPVLFLTLGRHGK